MAITKVTYSADLTTLVTTGAVDALPTLSYASTGLFDNTSSVYVDVLVGGIIATTATTVAAGETIDIYVQGNYQTATATDIGGGQGTGLTADADLTADTHFNPLNLTFLTSVAVEATSPDAAIDYHWGPIGVAQCFGGHMPQKFLLVVYNGTGSALGTCMVNAVGITYTSA